MRRALVAAALLLAGCKPMNRFEVTVTDPEATHARLELCGRLQTLRPTRKGFALRIPADCRGAGRIVLQFKDQADVACPIRFVDPSLYAWYRFEEASGVCVIR